MRAAGFYKHGGPEVLETIEVEDPMPGENDVIVRVPCTSVNPLDLLVRKGVHGLKLEMPHIPGCDVSGKVEEVGKNVRGLEVGDPVIASTVFGCGTCKACLSNDEVSCRDWKTIGLQTNGAYGELVKIPAANALRRPTNYSDEELACLPISLSISWRALHVLAKAKEGETVLIRAASGNAGLFCVALAHAMGLKVIALTRGSEKRDLLRKRGADHVLDYNSGEENTIKEVLELTNGEGADIVIESMGATLGSSPLLTKVSGRIVLFGTVAGANANVNVMPFYLKNITVFGTRNANRQEFGEALAFISEHNIRPLIAKRMGIEEAAEAHRLLESYSLFGKIVLKHR